jgi:hypothetical protein
MDVSDASYYISVEKKKNKGSQMGRTKLYETSKLDENLKSEFLPHPFKNYGLVDIGL